MISKHFSNKTVEAKQGSSTTKACKKTCNEQTKARKSSRTPKQVPTTNTYVEGSTTIGSNTTNASPATDANTNILTCFNEAQEKVKGQANVMTNITQVDVYEEWKNGQLDSLLQLYLMFKRNYDYAKQLVKKSGAVEQSDKVIASFVKQVIIDFDRVNSAIEQQQNTFDDETDKEDMYDDKMPIEDPDLVQELPEQIVANECPQSAPVMNERASQHSSRKADCEEQLFCSLLGKRSYPESIDASNDENSGYILSEQVGPNNQLEEPCCSRTSFETMKDSMPSKNGKSHSARVQIQLDIASKTEFNLPLPKFCRSPSHTSLFRKDENACHADEETNEAVSKCSIFDGPEQEFKQTINDQFDQDRQMIPEGAKQFEEKQFNECLDEDKIPQIEKQNRRQQKLSRKEEDKEFRRKLVWSQEEHNVFIKQLRMHGKNYKAIAKALPHRSIQQISRRANYIYYSILGKNDTVNADLLELLRPRKLGDFAKIKKVERMRKRQGKQRAKQQKQASPEQLLRQQPIESFQQMPMEFLPQNYQMLASPRDLF